MKRIISILISVFIIIGSVLFVSAAQSVSFALGSVEAENNRIVSVDVYADSKSELSAAVFDFTFDERFLEFRDVDSDENTTIKYNPTDEGVRAVYLCLNNSALNNKSIFSLSFKTLKEGRAEVGFTVSDCADSGGEFLDVGKCSGGSVGISGTDYERDKSSGSGSADEKSGSSSSKAPKDPKAERGDRELSDPKSDPGEDGIKNNGTLNDVLGKPNNLQWVLYVLIGLGIVIVLITGIKIGSRLSAKRVKKGEKPDNNE